MAADGLAAMVGYPEAGQIVFEMLIRLDNCWISLLRVMRGCDATLRLKLVRTLGTEQRNHGLVMSGILYLCKAPAITVEHSSKLARTR